jgi:hypothetical protein
MKNRAAEIHAGLKHPVIDGDGHWLEPVPIFLEYLREVGGAQSVDRMRALWQRTHAWAPPASPRCIDLSPSMATRD